MTKLPSTSPTWVHIPLHNSKWPYLDGLDDGEAAEKSPAACLTGGKTREGNGGKLNNNTKDFPIMKFIISYDN